MAEDTAVENQSEQPTESKPQAQAPTLDLQDLAMVLSLLNAAIKRGAFEPNELTKVGNAYNKLEAFLQHQAQLQAAAQKSREQEEGEA